MLKSWCRLLVAPPQLAQPKSLPGRFTEQSYVIFEGNSKGVRILCTACQIQKYSASFDGSLCERRSQKQPFKSPLHGCLKWTLAC